MRPVLLVLLALAPSSAANRATIHRDEFGVPRIYGRTDPDVVFGLAWAMAEDNFWQLEEDYIRQPGLAAQVYGRAGLEGDIRFRLFETATIATTCADTPAARSQSKSGSANSRLPDSGDRGSTDIGLQKGLGGVPRTWPYATLHS